MHSFAGWWAVLQLLCSLAVENLKQELISENKQTPITDLTLHTVHVRVVCITKIINITIISQSDL